MSEITAMQLLPILKQIESTGKNETAHRVRALASRIFVMRMRQDAHPKAM
jgi:hypothetical protein